MRIFLLLTTLALYACANEVVNSPSSSGEEGAPETDAGGDVDPCEAPSPELTAQCRETLSWTVKAYPLSCTKVPEGDPALLGCWREKEAFCCP